MWVRVTFQRLLMPLSNRDWCVNSKNHQINFIFYMLAFVKSSGLESFLHELFSVCVECENWNSFKAYTVQYRLDFPHVHPVLFMDIKWYLFHRFFSLSLSPSPILFWLFLLLLCICRFVAVVAFDAVTWIKQPHTRCRFVHSTIANRPNHDSWF